MTTLEQIKQKQDELNQMIKEFEESQNTPSEYGLEIREGDDYWFVDSTGKMANESWLGYESDEGRLSIGNCFETREQAEKHKLRLESMKPKYLPKEKNDEYWYVDSFCDEYEINYDAWKNDLIDQERYLLGRTFHTESEAQDWITNYAKAWHI